MKKTKFAYLALGFLAGIAYLIACGSATDMSKSLADPAPAEDESTTDLSTSLAGTWSGETTTDDGTFKAIITLNADGSYACSGDSKSEDSKTNPTLIKNDSSLCGDGTSPTWKLLGNRAIKFAITKTVSSDCSATEGSADKCPPPSSSTVTNYIIIPILFVDSTNLQLLTYYQDSQFGVTTLIK